MFEGFEIIGVVAMIMLLFGSRLGRVVTRRVAKAEAADYGQEPMQHEEQTASDPHGWGNVSEYVSDIVTGRKEEPARSQKDIRKYHHLEEEFLPQVQSLSIEKEDRFRQYIIGQAILNTPYIDETNQKDTIISYM